MTYEEKILQVQRAIESHRAKFGPVFRLRAFPDGVFRVSVDDSYYSETYGVMLYTEVFSERKASWGSFAKGTPQELDAQALPMVTPVRVPIGTYRRERGPESGSVADVSEAERVVKDQTPSQYDDAKQTMGEHTPAVVEETPMANGTVNNTSPSAAEVEAARKAIMGATNKSPAKSKATPVAAPTPTPAVLTISADDLKAVIAAAVAEAVKGVQPKAKAPKPTKAEKAAAKKAKKAELRSARREASKARSNDALTACVAESGKTEDEVKAAWKLAHAHANPFNAKGPEAYKAAYNEKLTELIGCGRYVPKAVAA